MVIQHVPWEKPGLINQMAQERGIRIDTLLVSTGTKSHVPEPATPYDGIVLMGGPMGALDDGLYPWLRQERELARNAVRAGIPILGICLGHQLIAVALGAELIAGGVEEIGIGTVNLSADSQELGAAGEQLPVLHWHRDSVTAPPDASVLASSPECPVQAFRIGSAVGVQFHVELTRSLLRTWLSEPAMVNDLPSGLTPGDLTAGFAEAERKLAAAGTSLIGKFLADVVESRERNGW